MIGVPAVFTPENQQAMYRRLIDATAYPGSIVDLSEWLDVASSTLGMLATLLDHTIRFCDADGLLGSPDSTLLECERAAANEASFVLRDGGRPHGGDFQPLLGDLYRPELGATLILQGDRLGQGELRLTLHGPGIQSTTSLAMAGFHASWFRAREAWVSGFPAGVDVVLCAGKQLSVLPRTTHIEVTSEE